MKRNYSILVSLVSCVLLFILCVIIFMIADKKDKEYNEQKVQHVLTHEAILTSIKCTTTENTTKEEISESVNTNTEENESEKNEKSIPAYQDDINISRENTAYISMDARGDTRKSFMDFTKITLQSSPQYKLQQLAETNEDGLRTVNGRYCIAVGSRYTTLIGQYIDLILENGEIIPCILGDQKDDKHTDEENMIALDGSLSEFIVETDRLCANVKVTGDVSYLKKKWKSNVSEVIVYCKNLFTQ